MNLIYYQRIMMLALMQKFLVDRSLDCFILPINDESFFEYVPDQNNRILAVTGFTGSYAFLIFLKESKNIFFTDSRYLLQAQNEIDLEQWKIVNIIDLSPYELIDKNNLKVGYDPKLMQYQKINNLKCDLYAIEQNPIDLLYNISSSYKKFNVFEHKHIYSGINSIEKINQIKLDKPIFINNSEYICWLLNIRSDQIFNTPIFFCYAILYPTGDVDLFFDISNANLRFDVPKNISLFDINEIKNIIHSIDSIYLMKDGLSQYIYDLIRKNIKDIFFLNEKEILLCKSIKNNIEIDGAVLTHVKDSIVFVKLFFWITNNNNIFSEEDVANKLYQYRSEYKEFFGNSFDTICGYNGNGAIVHYNYKKNQYKKDIKGNGLLLIDSGGQYYSGTTDTTRTILIGKPSTNHIFHYTLVLKGLIALTNIAFPMGTKCCSLDILARQFLWKKGLDYGHGTGHGVGSFLSVHEGPQSFSSDVILKENMLITNEPGVYFADKYGIRIENILLVVKSDKENFLTFKTLTMVPLESKLIDFTMLDCIEKKWLIDYSLEIKKSVYDFLDDKLKQYIDIYIQDIYTMCT